ncbi:MAG: histidine phosphatase family protein [Patescibacteria group bacterium]
MKTIYFVRHGESEGNIGTHYQEESTPLSENGRAQAEAMADRAKRLTLDGIVASTMVRAQETAAAISLATGIPVVSTDLLIERRRPSEQVNQLKVSPAAVLAEEEIIKNSGIPGYRYSDEENFDELMERAALALSYLRDHPGQDLLVVTHGVFLRVLVTYAIFGEGTTEREFKGILNALTCSNTGLTVLKHDASRECPWSLLTWNDHAHLG